MTSTSIVQLVQGAGTFTVRTTHFFQCEETGTHHHREFTEEGLTLEAALALVAEEGGTLRGVTLRFETEEGSVTVESEGEEEA